MTAESLISLPLPTSATPPSEETSAESRLASWLDSVRQHGGFGGPVAHWWQCRYRYTGPGLDWRYEGILRAYATLLQKTGHPAWRARLELSVDDLLLGQSPDGSFKASRFETNPGSLGTPHEAAASWGLIVASPWLAQPDLAVNAARRNLNNLLARLWDEEAHGFDDLPAVPGRVPNKLATLGGALISLARVTGDERYLPYARAALDCVLHYQVRSGRHRGAIHQYAPGARNGDGRFFPYYNARCVEPLLLGASVFAQPDYEAAARAVLSFLRSTLGPDGGWPQVVYAGGTRAEWPRWIAGSADIMLAFRAAGEEVPVSSLERLLAAQLSSGAYPTAQGFASQLSQVRPRGLPDYRDVTPVTGWNDKAFRLLAELLPGGSHVSVASPIQVERIPVRVGPRQALAEETGATYQIRAGEEVLYAWKKDEPWARVVCPAIDLR